MSRRSLVIRSLFALCAAVLLAQLVPYGRDHRNPKVIREPSWDSPATRALARRACFDCHSNETRWPWYASVAPVSWLVARDVARARRMLDFSEFDRAQRKAHDAADEVRGGDMPLWYYALMHPAARLSSQERTDLAAGLERTLGASGRGQ